MHPATEKKVQSYSPSFIQQQQHVSGSSEASKKSQALDSVSPSRVKSTLERTINVASLNGESIGNVYLPFFLKYLYQYLQEINCPPKSFEATGGAVAYLIGPDNASKYAQKEGLSKFDVSEFDRLQDLDISIDLSDHSPDVLFSMCYCVIKALQKSGIHKSYSELMAKVFLRKKITDDKTLCILSIGNSNHFWVDLSFVIQGRGKLFERDNLQCDLTPYLLHQKLALKWSTKTKDRMLPIRNRLEKKLDMEDVESINHLGFPLALYYAAKGYTISNFSNLKILVQKFIDFHTSNAKGYAETFENIRKNHIGSHQDIYEKMLCACLRELLFSNPPQLMPWIKSTELKGDTPACRLYNFIKNNGMEKYLLSASDILCLAELMGVEPHLPIPHEAWSAFLQKKVLFSKSDSLHLFSINESFPLWLTKRMQQKTLNIPSISPSALLELFDSYEFHDDKKEFIDLKFAWECKHTPLKALRTLSKYKNTLHEENIHKLLEKISALDCRQLRPYLPEIFSHSIDVKFWLQKLLQDNLHDEAIHIALQNTSLENYAFLLDAFITQDRIQNFRYALSQLSQREPKLYQALMQQSAWQDKVAKYLSDESDFAARLEEYVKHQQYPAAENLLARNVGKYTISQPILEKIISERCLHLFEHEEFTLLELLIQQSTISKIDPQVLCKHIDSFFHKLSTEGDHSKKTAWIFQFFSQPELAHLTSPFAKQLMKLASSHLNLVSSTLAETLLKLSLQSLQAANTPDSSKVFCHCMQQLQLQKGIDKDELCKDLTTTAESLINSNDMPTLLMVLKEVRALKLMLPISENALSKVLTLQSSDEIHLQLIKALETSCSLPEDAKRQLLELQLLHLCSTKPKQAVALFENNPYYWIRSQETLKSLFDKLPVNTALKFSVFCLLPQWSFEDWKQIVQTENIKEGQLLQILTDPRASLYIDAQWMEYFILTKNASLENSLILLQAYPLPLSFEFLMAYYEKLKAQSYPINTCLDFIKRVSRIDTPMFTDNQVETKLKEILRHLHKKCPSSLIDTIFDVDLFISKLPSDSKTAFGIYFLECLPIDFEDNDYSNEERACLNTLLEKISTPSNFSVYLDLTDEAVDKNEKGIQTLLKANMFRDHRPAIKSALSDLSKILSKNPAFWEPVGRQFVESYLSDKNTHISPRDILDVLNDTDHPHLQHLYLTHALKSNSSDYDKSALKYLIDLTQNSHLECVDNIISHPNFSKYLNSGHFANAFKTAVESYLLKSLDLSNNNFNEKKQQLLLSKIIPKIAYCHFKDVSFDRIRKKFAHNIGQCLLLAADKSCFYDLMNSFGETYSNLFGSKKLGVEERKALTMSTISPELVGRSHPHVCRFHMECLNVLLENFKAFTSSCKHPEKQVDHIVRMLNNIMSKLHPEASKEFYCVMQLFLHHFFNAPTLYNNVKMCTSVFDVFEKALSNYFYTGAYEQLLETVNTFSGKTFQNESLTPIWMGCCIKAFNVLYDDKAFDKFWKTRQDKFVTNNQLVRNYGAFLNNIFCALPPTSPYFPSFSANLMYVLADIQRKKYPLPAFVEILAWSIYLGNSHNNLDERHFNGVMQNILDYYPLANIDLAFSWLLQRYLKTLTINALNISKPILGFFDQLLGMLPIGKASEFHVSQVSQFLDEFMPYCEKHLPQASNLQVIFMQTVLKWLLPSPQDALNIAKTRQILKTMKQLCASSLSKGSSLLIIGSLRKMTEHICSFYSTSSEKSELDELCMSILDLILNPAQIPDTQTRSLWEPVVFNICEKILGIVNPSNHKKIKNLLQSRQIQHALGSQQRDKLLAMINK